MAHSSYSASERRGILAIGIIILLIIGAGAAFTLLKGTAEPLEADPVVIEHPELVDSVELKMIKENSKERKENSKEKKEKKAKKKKTSTTGKSSSKKIRQRSPLDEPV